MSWNIDFRDKRPLYEQLVSAIEGDIISGVLSPDEMLPSVRSLATDLSINPNTIQKAYAELTREGFMYTVKGKGNFVAGNPNLMDRKKDELKNRLSEIRKEGAQLGIDMDALWAQTREDN
jgi:GntR family transcriptional regulator